MSFEVPVLLLLFNRPDHTEQVLSSLTEIQPKSLYVAIDGPRQHHPTDPRQVAKSLALLETVTWPCTIHYLIRDNNLGCKQAVSSAISWFFEHVDAGIILEDDCIPNVRFFSYCAELLSKYYNDNSVMHIGGANLVNEPWQVGTSYVFTKICHIWGWATWRRAWQHYDLAMSSYSSQGESLINQVVQDKQSNNYWKAVFEEAYANKVDTWDYQWVYSIWMAQGLCVLPCVNMITNIGFDENATHTKSVTAFAGLPSYSLGQLRHPELVAEDKAMSDFLFRKLYRHPSALTTFWGKIKRGINRLKRHQP